MRQEVAALLDERFGPGMTASDPGDGSVEAKVLDHVHELGDNVHGKVVARDARSVARKSAAPLRLGCRRLRWLPEQMALTRAPALAGLRCLEASSYSSVQRLRYALGGPSGSDKFAHCKATSPK